MSKKDDTSLDQAAEPADDAPSSPTPEAMALRDAFDLLYSRWLAARAAVFDVVPSAGPRDIQTGKVDDLMDERLEACDQAVRELLLTPAPLEWGVWYKIEVFELLLEQDYREGERTDRLTIIALAAIKADLMRFGLGSPKD